jgi:hypothetical protein
VTPPRLITGDLKLAYALSIVSAALLTLVSVAGLIDWAQVYPGVETSLLALLVGQDALNLIVGLPILLGSMWLARRGSLIGLLLWPGALFYVLYDYGYYVLGAPFTAFFLVYIALMSVSAYAMISVLRSVDADVVRDRLVASIRSRVVGGSLAGIAILFTALWSALSLSASASGVALEMIPRTVVTLDLTIQLPALFVGGILLLRHRPLGYVVAAGLLLQASAYLAGLSVITVLGEAVTRVPFDPFAVVPGIVVGVVGFVLMGAFVRASRKPSLV